MAAGAERYPAMDMVRGFALLGILLMNIVSFGLPIPAYANPVYAGPVSTADMAAWFLAATLADGRMRALFAMLFGASMLIVAERLGVAAHLRRMLVLAMTGLLHALFVWHGDILLPYALLGLLLFPATRVSAHGLGLMAAIAITLQAMVQGFTAWHIMKLEAVAGTSPEAARMLMSWRGALTPPPAEIAHEIEVFRGGYGGILRFRLPLLLRNWNESLPVYFLLETAGQMLAGMALMKAGFWQGALPRRQYRWLAATLSACDSAFRRRRAWVDAWGFPAGRALWNGNGAGADRARHGDRLCGAADPRRGRAGGTAAGVLRADVAQQLSSDQPDRHGILLWRGPLRHFGPGGIMAADAGDLDDACGVQRALAAPFPTGTGGVAVAAAGGGQGASIARGAQLTA